MEDYLSSRYGAMIRESIEQNTTMQIKEAIRLAPFNRIKRGLISAKIAGTPNYELMIDNKKYFPVSALKGALPLSVGDLVICIVPDNQMSNMFILGALSDTDNTN